MGNHQTAGSPSLNREYGLGLFKYGHEMTKSTIIINHRCVVTAASESIDFHKTRIVSVN